MAINLVRNSKVYFTTLLNSSDQVPSSGFLSTNTWRIDVLDGFTFSQATGTETVTLNEAGSAPVRGQRMFNTSLEPAEFSFSTYIRPYYVEAGASDTISAPEKVLWNALFGNIAIGTANAAWIETAGGTGGTTICQPTNQGSNQHQLQKFGLIIVLDSLTYFIDNCALDTATIDFGLDQIATVSWTGRGAAIRQTETAPTLAAGTNFTDVPATTRFLANKLSTLTVTSNISGTSGTPYTVALTGGQLQINNNITYLTPAVMGKVNTPITYFTGTRAISGNTTCYLKSDASANLSAELQAAILTTSATASETKYQLVLSVGGSSNSNRVDITIPAAMLSVPNVSVEQVISLGIDFTAQGYTGSSFDVEQANEIKLQYYAVA